MQHSLVRSYTWIGQDRQVSGLMLITNSHIRTIGIVVLSTNFFFQILATNINLLTHYTKGTQLSLILKIPAASRITYRPFSLTVLFHYRLLLSYLVLEEGSPFYFYL